ncbi:kynurenine 3-monooxygenase-like [Ruditapes philippinarum]|uniref:kynurenine 3-monooxygenase-like n=1 Tax=Ruditapes philippinarum TaxID=129788 RepID=UPI00295B37CC|nr:kynurenine 3-monooxygenase-like [Ruditapes philippinarum]
MKTVIVIGGGLVGALQACFMAKRGYKVDIYEMRSDIRTMEVVRGRSINLALSVRGREALRRAGVEDTIVKYGIPMYSRMIHDRDGKRRPIPYGKKDQYIMSIDRRHLNEILLTEAEKFSTVTTHFEHKVVECNFNEGSVTFQKKDGSVVTVKADMVIGCDGAYSKVRQEMMKKTLLDYEQIFIPHGYMELSMPPAPNDKYAMEINYLHIWARNEYMMIALPNYDKSFTVTLFMPFDIFKTLTTETAVLDFFKTNFADSIPLLGEKALVETVIKNKALPMVTVKCSPYNVKDKFVIMGDAAHAMVPFYGQGMNCGFEDCVVFCDLLDKHEGDFGATLHEFTSFRSIDAKAMCDLAFYNYIEMRQSVNSRLFLMRKKLDNFLFWLLPNTWIPLYTTVSFSRKRYHECIKNKEWQDRVIQRALYISIPTLAVAGYYMYKQVEQLEVPLHEKLVQLAERFVSKLK